MEAGRHGSNLLLPSSVSQLRAFLSDSSPFSSHSKSFPFYLGSGSWPQLPSLPCLVPVSYHQDGLAQMSPFCLSSSSSISPTSPLTLSYSLHWLQIVSKALMKAWAVTSLCPNSTVWPRLSSFSGSSSRGGGCLEPHLEEFHPESELPEAQNVID